MAGGFRRVAPHSRAAFGRAAAALSLGAERRGGELLMSLGALTTIATRSPANLALVILDNESYVETGAQATATAGPPRPWHSEGNRINDLWEHSKALPIRRGGKPLVQADERERTRELLLDQQGRAQLSRIGGPQRVSGQQRVRPRANGEHVGHFVPSIGEHLESVERLATLPPRQ